MKFLKPNLLKIVLAIALLVVTGYLWRMFVISRISDTFPWGFPFQYYLAWGPCPPGETCFEFNWLFLILDVLLWYGIAAFLVDRVQKRR